MELRLTNFRCYRSKTFVFPRGVLLIDGASGKGKTTILTAIKYVLFGKVTQISTYGEKKTTVELLYNDMIIVRTNSPSRLLVTFQGKTLEDDAAQEHLYKIFGRQFELTSYMVQKGAIQFFTLSGAEKLKLLEQLSLLGEDNIQQMKDSIQRDIKEKRRQMEKMEHQTELLESQLGTAPQLTKKKGLSTLSEIEQVLQFLIKIKEGWDAERVSNDSLLETYTTKMKEQRHANLARESLMSALRHEKAEVDRLMEEKRTTYVDDDTIQSIRTTLRDHDAYTIYVQKEKERDETVRMYTELVQKETEMRDKEIKRLEEQRIPVNHSVDDVRSQMARLNVIEKLWKQLYDVSRCLQNEETIQKQVEACTIDDTLLSSFTTRIKDHDLFLIYHAAEKDVEEKKRMYNEMIDNENASFLRNIAELEAQLQDEPLDTTDYQDELQKCHKCIPIWKRIREIRVELANEKLKDIDTRFETTKKNKDKIEKFIASMEVRKCVQSCPQCNTSLLVHSSKIVSAEHQPISEADKKTEEKYIADLPKWHKQYENQYRLIVSRDEWKKEEDKLLLEVEGTTEDELVSRIQAIQSETEASKLVQHTNRLIQAQIADKRTQDPLVKYKDFEQKWKSAEKKLSTLEKGVECLEIEHIRGEEKQLVHKKEKYAHLCERLREVQSETKSVLKDANVSFIPGYRMFINTGEWEESFRAYVDGKTERDVQDELSRLSSLMDETVRIQHVNTMIEKQLSVINESVPDKKYSKLKDTIQTLNSTMETLSIGKECMEPDETRTRLHQLLTLQKEHQRIVSLLDVLQTSLAKKEEEANVPWDDTDYETLLTDVMKRQAFVTEKLVLPTQQIAEYTLYYEQVKQYLAYKRKAEQIKEKQVICAIYYSQLEQLESLFQHILHAEGICLEQFIRRVNQKMKWYLEQFFPDQSLQMELSTEKECKSGKIKNEICVQLIQKQQVCDLKNLSGGEYDRCALAFMLTINELSHSPCLFLDESISSLDMSLSEQVLDVIKEKQTELRKLVLLISHQANTGFFDHVISI